MDFRLDNGWQIRPIGGSTGMAYMGINEEQQKLFIKRNTSPFLAALSLEKITPRLVWTKHTSTGDTLTAQEWLNGRCLKRKEMKDPAVAKLIARVHQSNLLKTMLRQVGGVYLSPADLLGNYFRGLSSDLRHHPLLKKVANFLRANQPMLDYHHYQVSHGDLNHKNWLLSDNGRLYLVDWESAALADPALDLSMLMRQYVPRQDWQDWLINKYQIRVDQQLKKRLQWYEMVQLLLEIKEFHQRGRFFEMNRNILDLAKIFKKMI